MKRLMKALAYLLTLSLLLGSIPYAFAQNDTGLADPVGEDYVQGEVLFNYIPGAAEGASLSSIENDLGIKVLEAIDQTALNAETSLNSVENNSQTLYRAGFDSEKMTVFELCKVLNALPCIEDAEPNYLYAPDSFNMPSEITTSSLYASEQKWYFDNMGLTSAWQQYENLGEGVVVCVIDNGLNFTHNDINDNLWDDGNGNHGYNAEYNNHDIYGKLSGGPAHGSHCAGIIAMEANNGGLVGVAPKAKIMACNAVSTSTGMFTNANLIKSLEYAVANGADVISMSLGGYSYSVNMEKALAKASLHAVILCAAGNEATNAATALHYPSASSAVIGVMALGSGSSANTLSSYSNYDLTGRYYQVAAPGTDIYAIAAQSDTGYVSKSGTSMATPFMAGLAALYVSEHPELSAPEARRAIIDAAGEMVAGYSGTYTQKPFTKARPLTLLGESCAPASNVTINDKQLNTAVREALNVDTYHSFTNYELECVSTLDLSGSDFHDYSALSALPKLTSLNLSATGMTDADAAGLKTYLPDTLLNFDISHNSLTNLDLFSGYAGYVSRVVASHNEINNIAGVANFTMLSDLDISYNCVKNISAVSSLSGLVYLYAPGNEIEDATPIIGLSMLEEVYFGNYNPNFTDMFGELYFLSGSAGNKISNLAPFMNINQYRSKLHYINLSYNYVNLDEQFNYRAAKLLQILDYIGSHNDFNSIFAEAVTYKLVLSPFAKGNLIFANDIAFENDRNFATLYMNGDGFAIPYSVLPQAANAKTGVSFSVRDNSVAFVDNNGVIYPKAAGSTYVTLTLESGKVRTFFITVSDSFVMQAGIATPATTYFAGVNYQALIYTAPCEEISLTDQNGNSFGTHDAGGKYCYNLTDAHGNDFQRWLVPLYAENAGDYQIAVTAKAKKAESESATVGSFRFNAMENFGNELSGIYTMYNSRFDTKVSLIAADETVLQTVIYKGGIGNTGHFRFNGVANGVYTVKVESDGYKPFYFENVTVNGDTFIDDNIDGAASFTACAGDINGDGCIDIGDISVLLSDANYAKDYTEAGNILCDINADNCVSMDDLQILLANNAK